MGGATGAGGGVRDDSRELLSKQAEWARNTNDPHAAWYVGERERLTHTCVHVYTYMYPRVSIYVATLCRDDMETYNVHVLLPHTLYVIASKVQTFKR